MTKAPFLIAAGFVLIGLPSPSRAGDAKEELQQLVAKVNAKIQAGKNTEPDLADELKGFDTLLAEHKGEKTDDVAQILLMKGMLYATVTQDAAKAAEVLKQVKQDYPDTAPAKNADDIIDSLAKEEAANKIQSTLVEGSQFPGFDEKDLEGKPLSVAGYHGKLVMIDFWATWCGPCVHELPNVLKAYGKYHDKGFEIIGVSLDSSKDKLTAFLKENKMAWPQYFDGQGWQNKLAAKYGITSIPSTYLLDKEGKIIGKGLRGDALDTALEQALAAK